MKKGQKKRKNKQFYSPSTQTVMYQLTPRPACVASPTDCTEEDPGDHSAGQTAGTEAPAGRCRVTAPLQVTSGVVPAGASQ